MRLTGKAKELFEAWFTSCRIYWSVPCFHNGVKSIPSVEDFYYLPDQMQWGVIQDWADSIGYEIGVTSSDIGFAVWLKYVWIETHETRQEARNAAIEKLNQLINEK